MLPGMVAAPVRRILLPSIWFPGGVADLVIAPFSCSCFGQASWCSLAETMDVLGTYLPLRVSSERGGRSPPAWISSSQLKQDGGGSTYVRIGWPGDFLGSRTEYHVRRLGTWTRIEGPEKLPSIMGLGLGSWRRRFPQGFYAAAASDNATCC
jgi:hypothetical protein